MIVPIYIRERIFIPRAPELDQTLTEIRHAFTYANPDYIKRKRLKKWTGSIQRSISIWEHVDHPVIGESLSLPRGGINKVRDILEQNGHKPTFIDKRLSLKSITHLYNDVTLRPDQERLADAMLKTQNCLIRSPTGSGKTETALKVAEYILKDAGPVLVIVWETDLMEEWMERAAKRFGLRVSDIGQLGGGKKKRIAPITVGMQQTLRNCGRQYSGRFGGVICDEIQRFAAGTYREVIDIFPSKYRIGVSADETRNDGQEFLIYDMFGDVAEEIARATLIDQGAIHDVIIRLVPTEYEYSVYDHEDEKWVDWVDADAKWKDFNKLLDDLCYDEYRNELAWAFMEPSIKLGHTLLLISHRVEHAIWWDMFLRSKGVKSGLLLGGAKFKQEFKDTKAGLRAGNLQVGVGTIKKIGQALDIPRWDRGFILTPAAGNKQQFEQIIGRLRRTHSEKTEAICYYLFDQFLYPHHKRIIRKNYPHTYIWVEQDFLPVSVR
jgi:superfamily II DNA or RNA helicase